MRTRSNYGIIGPAITITTPGGGVYSATDQQLLKSSGFWPGAPGVPTMGTASLSGSDVSVPFTAPAATGGTSITGYTVTSNPGNITATGTSSPILINGLTPGTSYTFTVKATNIYGTSPDSNSSNSLAIPLLISYFIVAGGGAGGGANFDAGGGGAGGYLTATNVALTIGTTYTITVGAGGTAAAATIVQGSNSSISGSGFTTVTAVGGGGGSSYNGAYLNAGNGGSGGGGGGTGNGGKGVYIGSTYLNQARQGYDGANGRQGGSNAGGGGGGAGGLGIQAISASSAGGAGGVGVVNPFIGSTVGQNVSGTYYLAGGGGGGVESAVSYAGGAGGNGGGGGGRGTNNASPVVGLPNTGGGGGGGGASGAGANGGSGVCVIQVASTITAASTTGSPTVTPIGAYKYYIFTGSSGSITF
jgi:hypothetical protein